MIPYISDGHSIKTVGGFFLYKYMIGLELNYSQRFLLNVENNIKIMSEGLLCLQADWIILSATHTEFQMRTLIFQKKKV